MRIKINYNAWNNKLVKNYMVNYKHKCKLII